MRTRSNRCPALLRGVVSSGAAIAVAFAAAPLLAQESIVDSAGAARPQVVVVSIGGGAAMSAGPEQTVPADAREERLGLSFTGRVLWRPGHLLGIGLQSGYTRISTMRTSAIDETLFLSVVPAMIVFSMETHDVDVSVATGWQRYIVSTETRGLSSAWEMGYHASVAWTPVTFGALGIGIEASWASLPEREIGAGSLQLRLRMNL